jgi:hypothetical protein
LILAGHIGWLVDHVYLEYLPSMLPILVSF